MRTDKRHSNVSDFRTTCSQGSELIGKRLSPPSEHVDSPVLEFVCLERYNAVQLVHTIHTSLAELNKVIRGNALLSSDVQKLASGLLKNEVEFINEAWNLCRLLYIRREFSWLYDICGGNFTNGCVHFRVYNFLSTTKCAIFPYMVMLHIIVCIQCRFLRPGTRCGRGLRIPFSTCAPWWPSPWLWGRGRRRGGAIPCYREGLWTSRSSSIRTPSSMPSGSRQLGVCVCVYVCGVPFGHLQWTAGCICVPCVCTCMHAFVRMCMCAMHTCVYEYCQCRIHARGIPH